MKEQIIHLEPHDDAISVRDKLGWVQATHVLLVFPTDPSVQILPRKLDLILIQREATRRQAQLALITHDADVIDNANEVGIAHFPTVEASHGRTWRMAQAQLSVERSEEQVPLDPELAQAASRLRILSDEPHRHVTSGMKYAALGGVLAVSTALAVAAIPGAAIRLAPATTQVTVTTTVTADPSLTEVQVDEGLIPARSIGVVVEGHAAVDVTGTTDVPTEKARGIALFTNRIPDQVTIPAGTIVRTSAAEPVRFVTLADATLAGTVGETVEVPIEAVDPGFGANVPTGRVNEIDGPLSSRLAVANPEPTRGGSVSTVPAVAPQDLDRVEALLRQQLLQRAYAEMRIDPMIALLDTEFVPFESLTVVLTNSKTFDGYVGQPVSQLGLTMSVTIQGVAVDERSAREIPYARLAEKVGPGFVLTPETLVFRRGEVTGFDDQRRVTFIMQAAGDISAEIEVETIRNMVRGRSPRAAIRDLDQTLMLVAPPTVEMWPGFWPWMPLWPARISVEVVREP